VALVKPEGDALAGTGELLNGPSLATPPGEGVPAGALWVRPDLTLASPATPRERATTLSAATATLVTFEFNSTPNGSQLGHARSAVYH
jgi:hypothetical protein